MKALPALTLHLRTIRCFSASATSSSNSTSNANPLTRNYSLGKPRAPHRHTSSTNGSPVSNERQSSNGSINAQSITASSPYLAAHTASLREKTRLAKQSQTDQELRRSTGRRWAPGDVYSPRDLSALEQSQWLVRRKGKAFDAFDMIGAAPQNFYKNMVVMGEFVSDSGLLLRRDQTGLSKVNQRKVLKAVRRARGVGMLPTTHKHPQLLARGIGGVMNKA